MKKNTFLLIAIFFWIPIFAQVSSKDEQYPIDKKVEYYLGSIDIGGISIAASFDTWSKIMSYANSFPNISNKVLTYVNNGNRVQFKIRTKLLAGIKNYRFAVVDDLKNTLLSGRLEDLTFKKHGIFGYIAELPITEIRNKNISVTLYNEKNPSQQGTAIIYNTVIPKTEIIFLGREVIDRSNRSAVEMKTDASKIIFDKDVRGFMVAVKKNDYSSIYSLLVKEKKTGKVVFKSNSWNYSFYTVDGIGQPNISIGRENFKNSGEYEIIIRPELEKMTEKEMESSSFRQNVKIQIDRIFSMKDMIMWSLSLIIIFSIISFLLIYVLRTRNRKKIREESLYKKISETKLISIQAQLNPHFLFNSLASIQSFINNNDVDNANRYLSKFARLTRNVLDSESVNILADERDLLTDYLQMEQLRFGFEYGINVNDLDPNNIEIPTMLLQPLVENAIKHGISELKEGGKIGLYFERKESAMMITIIDNGRGYDVAHTPFGLGIKLTNERIQLWNELHPETNIFINTESKNTGTCVSLIFKNWL
ncbi:sensor histidine kinase [uncultured Sphingobacterium sp.]|uniref:sensor histidine kinase n=1 Tax=uncultured Sphingobacterium sp. TaxID=182688 RepID=UPI0037489919